MDLSQSKTNNQTKFDSGVHFASYVSVGKNKKITSLKHHNTHAQENCALKFVTLRLPAAFSNYSQTGWAIHNFCQHPKVANSTELLCSECDVDLYPVLQLNHCIYL